MAAEVIEIVKWLQVMAALVVVVLALHRKQIMVQLLKAIREVLLVTVLLAAKLLDHMNPAVAVVLGNLEQLTVLALVETAVNILNLQKEAQQVGLRAAEQAAAVRPVVKVAAALRSLSQLAGLAY